MKKNKALLLGIAMLMILSLQTKQARAEEKYIINPSFEDELVKNDIQTYKAKRTTEKASDGEYSIKVGSKKPTNEADVPLWAYNYGKGMVSVIIRNIEPNTKYKITCDTFDEGDVSMTTGVLDLEGEQFPSGSKPWEPWKLKSIAYGMGGSTNPDTGWKTNVRSITTGYRTTELYAFAYMNWTGDEKGAGEFYIDNFKIEKVGNATKQTPQTIGYKVQSEGAFPETIPAIQDFNKNEGDDFKLTPEYQIFSSDKFSMEKTKYLAECMVNKGIIKDYTIKTINTYDQGEGITVFKQALRYELPENIKTAASKGEAYQIDINKNKAAVYANDIRGIQNGTMTLLQAFTQRMSLPAGSVHDYTDQVVRGLQVDSGRRYYSIDWLKNQIEQMAYNKQNKLQLRLKDNEGIRYDSKVAPSIVDRKGGFWTKTEVMELVNYARQFNIEVIPEIDFPGHAEQEAALYPEWRLTPTADALDFSKPEVREYMINIYKEAADFFDADTIHIGGDEYFQSKLYPSADTTLEDWAKAVTNRNTATKYDALKLFFNEAATELFKKDLKVIIWNDNIMELGGVVPLNKKVVVDFWAGGVYGSIKASTAANSGYNVMSSSSSNYHDLWPNTDKLDRPLPRRVFEEFTRYHYSNSSTSYTNDEILTTNLDKSLGQMFPIWDDAHGYVSEYILSRSLFPRYSGFAYKTWGADYKEATTYAEFERLAFSLGSPRKDMNKQVTINYNVKDLEYVADIIDNSLSKKRNIDPVVSKKVNDLKLEVIDIQNNPSTYLDEDGFATNKINNLVKSYENVGYVANSGEIAVHYIDIDGKELAKSEMKSNEVGVKYTTEAKVFDGYELTKIPSNATGRYTVEKQMIDYVYSKQKASVTPPKDEQVTPPEVTPPKDNQDVTSQKNKDNVKTSDQTNTVVYVGLLVITGITITIFRSYRKRSR